jgi:catechol 2,3-dioxygenase-like lactoylglutathione lyase family enzyme
MLVSVTEGTFAMAIARDLDGQTPSATSAKTNGSALTPVTIEAVSAITLATHDMPRAVRFYRALGFELHYGGEDASFTSLTVGCSYLNIVAVAPEQAWSWWGRVIFHVSDVDAAYQRAQEVGIQPEFPPCDAPWGERYFHLTDPDGHELSFARPLEQQPR